MTLVDLLRDRAQHQPDQHIYTFQGQDAEAPLTAGELDHQARMIGGSLQHMELPEQRVLLLYPPGLDYIAAFFGCLYANMVPVPAYLPPSNRPAPRLRAIIADAQPVLALTTSATLANLRLQFDHTPELGALRWLTTDELKPEVAHAWQPPGITSATLAFLQYTSGSTAAPKGVMLTHGNLLHNLAQIEHAFGHGPESRGVIWLPPYHDMGLIGGILQPLYAGFPVTLMSPVSFLQRPLRWLETIARTGATTSGGPNFAYDLCVRKSTPEQRASLDLSSWTVAFCGAEPVRPSTIQRFAEAFACASFQREAFYPCYGLAEATLIVTGIQVSAPPTVRAFDREALARHRVALATSSQRRELVGCGAPFAAFDQQIAIVQPTTGRRCAPDEIGEIWVAGPSVAGGYWNRAAETEQTFAAYLAETNEGPFLRTGDLGFVQDGELFITGRLKELIIIHGRNYYPHDLELAAEQSHVALQPNASAAFGVDIDGAERLVIVHEVRRQHRSVSSDEVAAAVRRAVAEQHDVQVYAVVLIKPGSLPRTSSGKIQRHVCRSQFVSGSLPMLGASTLQPTEERDVPDALQLPPPALLIALDAAACELLVEQHLIEHMARLLGVSPGVFDREQPPSAFGLDSLAAVEIQHAVEAELGLVVPMTTFLETPSIAALARALTTQLRAADAIEQPDVEPAGAGSFPLSYGQRALWFLQQVAPQSAAYTIARAVRIGAATFDESALRAAFQMLVDRHPALRTTFQEHLGAPVQQVQPEMTVAFYAEDGAAWSHAELHTRLADAARRPFDLVHGPLVRVYLFRRDPGESIVLLTVHHLVADGWSLTVLLRELELLYSARVAGRASPLKPTTGAYADYVRWQADLLAGPRGETLWRYWQQQLGPQGTPALHLPSDRPRQPAQTSNGATQRFSIDAELVQRLKALAAIEGATLFMVCLAAFQALLYRYTEQPEIVVGSPSAGRSRARFADTVGYFVNPLVLRAALAADLRFVDLLRQARQTVLDALAHHEYPFPLLVERLSPDRDLSRSPMFQVMFSLEKHAWSGVDRTASSLNLEPVEMEQQTSQFDLELLLVEQGSSLDGALHYNTDLFEPDTIARLAAHYRILLAGIAACPEQPIAMLPLLTTAEQERLAAWNATAVPYPNDRAVHQLVEQQAARNPAASAVVDGSEALTYAALNRRANQLAHYLRTQGVGPDVLVALCVERSLEMIVGMLAILKAGGAYVPLDPAYPQERLAYMLDDSQVPVILTQAALVARLHHAMREGHPAPGTRHPAQVFCLDADWHTLAEQPTTNPPHVALPDHLAYLIYTSGSTGQPKGVAVPQRALLNLVAWHQRAVALSPRDRTTHLAGLAFEASVWEIWPALAAGAALYLPAPDTRVSPPRLREWLLARAITIAFAPTPLAEQVIALPWPSASPLRTLLTG
ncbi:MAG TPA: AMP-binding protein, partial [Herpetosiphonaceae bacterium]